MVGKYQRKTDRGVYGSEKLMAALQAIQSTSRTRKRTGESATVVTSSPYKKQLENKEKASFSQSRRKGASMTKTGRKQGNTKEKNVKTKKKSVKKAKKSNVDESELPIEDTCTVNEWFKCAR